MPAYGIRQDKELYDNIIKHFKVCRQEQAEMFREAEIYQKVYENEPWGALPDMTRPDHLSKLKIPIAEDVIETGLSVATARTPRPTIEPEIDPEKLDMLFSQLEENPEKIYADSDDQGMYDFYEKKATKYADGLIKELVKHWRESRMQKAIRNAYRQKSIKGTAFMKIKFDKNGQLTHEICDYESIFPSPGVHKICDHDNEIFLYATIRTARYVKRRYNITLKSNAIKTKNSCEKLRFESKNKFFYKFGQIITATKQSMSRITGHALSEDFGFCLLIEAYMPADNQDINTFEDEKYVEDPNGDMQLNEDNTIIKEKITIEEPKFPSGYKCVTIVYDHPEWILEETDCPYAPSGNPQPPFVKIAGYENDYSIWGTSEIKKIGDVISQICLAASNFNDVLRFTGNAPLIIAPGTTTEGDALILGEEELGETNELLPIPGEIYRETVPRSTRFLQPPSVGFDVKWWIVWLMGIVDRVTHLSDAIRGFNKYAHDSGRKIRELRAAATGTFGPKMDEVSEFCTDIFKMLAWIYINMMPNKVIIQKEEDEAGSARFNRFVPNIGKLFKFNIDVSARALLPEDTEEYFQIALVLYNAIVYPNGKHGVPPEVLVEYSNLPDSQRIKKFNAMIQEEIDADLQKQQVAEQFAQLSEQSENSLGIVKEEKEIINQMIQMIMQFPELLFSEYFRALDPRIKKTITKFIMNELNQSIQTEEEVANA